MVEQSPNLETDKQDAEKFKEAAFLVNLAEPVFVEKINPEDLPKEAYARAPDSIPMDEPQETFVIYQKSSQPAP